MALRLRGLVAVCRLDACSIPQPREEALEWVLNFIELHSVAALVLSVEGSGCEQRLAEVNRAWFRWLRG